MELVDRPSPPDLEGAGAAETNRSSRRWALLAAVLCPCHLWLVAGLVGFLGAGATADAIRDNQLWLAAVLAPMAAFALWRAVVAGRCAASKSPNGEPAHLSFPGSVDPSHWSST